MLFNSFQFLFAYLPLTLIVFFALGRWFHLNLQGAWLFSTRLKRACFG